MAKRLRRCGHCGEVIKPGAPTKFEARDPDEIYHELCFWGVAAAKNWSFLQRVGGRPPMGLRIACYDCGREIVTDHSPVWYERDFDIGGYWPYHPACAPSKEDD